MEGMKVSFIVPVYNVEGYLDQCIQSLIDQTYHNIEIILVNDGSTDQSSDICKKYAKMDERIIYINQTNQGVSVARNIGLRNATGAWVSFIDGDDWATSDMVSTLLNSADECDMIVGEAYAFEAGKITRFSFFDSQISNEKRMSLTYLIGNALGCGAYGATGPTNIGVPWARLYRRQFLTQNQIEFPANIKRMQDMIMNVKVFSCMPKIMFINAPIYYYRITDNSVSRKYSPLFENVANDILNCIYEPIEKNNLLEIRELYAYKAVWLLLENLKLYYCHPKCSLSREEKLAGIRRLCEKPDNAAALESCNKTLFSKKRRILIWLLANRIYGVAYGIHALINVRNAIKKSLA